MRDREIVGKQAQFWLSVAALEFKRQNLRLATVAAKRASQLAPDWVKTHLYLGDILAHQDIYHQAIAHYEKAIALDSSCVKAYIHLGETLIRLRKFESAFECFQTALENNPEAKYIIYHLSVARLRMCDWSKYEEEAQSVIQELDNLLLGNSTYVPVLYNLNYLPLRAEQYYRVAQIVANKIIRQTAHIKKQINFSHTPTTKNKLRIGYLSGDFCHHPTSLIIDRMFAYHDRSSFEINIYSTSNKQDYITEIVKAGCDSFIDISQLSTEAAAQLIYEDKIDILIDLAGYTANHRAAVLALQPAPIQAQWFGYCNTMGAKFVQYILADSVLIPPELAQYYSEEVVYLPHVIATSPSSRKEKVKLPQRSECGLPEDKFVFCCFNGHYKIEPQVFDIWMDILIEVPESILWLIDGTGKENLRHSAAQKGVDPQRLIFAPYIKEQAEYIARYSCADLFLDTFIYNASSTACTAIKGGLPMLTLQGKTNAARMGSSVCMAAGLDDLVCHTVEEYKNKAIHLATHPEELNQIRQKLQQQEDLPLFQLENFVRQLETALQQMWSQEVGD